MQSALHPSLTNRRQVLLLKAIVKALRPPFNQKSFQNEELTKNLARLFASNPASNLIALINEIGVEGLSEGAKEVAWIEGAFITIAEHYPSGAEKNIDAVFIAVANQCLNNLKAQKALATLVKHTASASLSEEGVPKEGLIIIKNSDQLRAKEEHWMLQLKPELETILEGIRKSPQDQNHQRAVTQAVKEGWEEAWRLLINKAPEEEILKKAWQTVQPPEKESETVINSPKEKDTSITKTEQKNSILTKLTNSVRNIGLTSKSLPITGKEKRQDIIPTWWRQLPNSRGGSEVEGREQTGSKTYQSPRTLQEKVQMKSAPPNAKAVENPQTVSQSKTLPQPPP